MNDKAAIDNITDAVNAYLRGEQSKLQTITRICAALGKNADHRESKRA